MGLGMLDAKARRMEEKKKEEFSLRSFVSLRLCVEIGALC
jgi:hypothetical protein